MVLAGPNGAGKTNVLDAISLLSPGRGLRGAALGDQHRKGPLRADGALWAVAATIARGGRELRARDRARHSARRAPNDGACS